jgi:hypothetical protein
METTIIILSLILGMSLLHLVRVKRNLNAWENLHKIENETIRIQRETIENLQATIETYKNILSNGVELIDLATIKEDIGYLEKRISDCKEIIANDTDLRAKNLHIRYCSEMTARLEKLQQMYKNI